MEMSVLHHESASKNADKITTVDGTDSSIIDGIVNNYWRYTVLSNYWEKQDH